MLIRKALHDDLKLLSKLIASCNLLKEHRIAYLGTDCEDILEYLTEIINEDANSIFIGIEDNKIIACLGVDCCEDNITAEILGPFMDLDYQYKYFAMKQLVEILISQYSKYRLCFFIDENNNLVKDYLEEIKCVYSGKHYVLNLNPNNFISTATITVEDYTPCMKESFIQLHSTLFPKAYYQGSTILDMQDDDYHLKVIYLENRVCGYIFYNTSDSYIDFIGVSFTYQKHGYGSSLLSTAIFHILSKNHDKEINLCVSEKNEIAISLYKKVGFELTYINESYYL